ncbi:MAG: mechanosensitive ion channel family protein [Solobacterium sp.]|nr:mechanosensitive ion channel family protein [Solobacterium sp.]
MRSLKRKLITGLIVLALATAVFGRLLRIAIRVMTIFDYYESELQQMEGLRDSIITGLELQNNVLNNLDEVSRKKTSLSALACQYRINENNDNTPFFCQSGAVIRVENKTVAYPSGFPEEVEFDAELLMEPEGTLYTSPYKDTETGEECVYCVNYHQLDETSWYIEWKDNEEILEEQSELFDVNKYMKGIEESSKMKMLLFQNSDSSSDSHLLLYRSEGLPDYSTTEEFGIDQEKISYWLNSETADKRTDLEVLKVDGKQYMTYCQRISEFSSIQNMVLICMSPYDETAALIREQIISVVILFLLISLFALIWYGSTLILVRDHSLNERQKEELRPRAVFRRFGSVVIVGSVIIAFTAAMLFSLFRLFSVYNQVDTSLKTLEQRLNQNQSEKLMTETVMKSDYEDYAVLIGTVLENNPDSATAAQLQNFCDVIGANYIMLFDRNGTEVLSNARYTGLTLGADPLSGTPEFTRLLNGVPLLSQNRETMTENVLIGVSYGEPDADGHYPSLLVAVPSEKIYQGAAENTGSILSSLVYEGILSFAVDPETKIIKAASESTLIGKSAAELGLPEAAFVSGYRDFFKLDGISYYGESAEIEGSIYCYAAAHNHIYRNVMSYALWIWGFTLVLLGVFTVVLLFDYRKYFDDWKDVGEELKEIPAENIPGSIRSKYSKDPSERWKPMTMDKGTHAPLHHAFLALQALLLICILIIGIRVTFNSSGSSNSLISFIIQGDWTKGWNLFSFISILLLLGEVIVVVTITRLVLYLISNAFGTRGETICRLLVSLVSYGGVIFFVYSVFYYLGFQPNTLLASLGLMSFAVSLGAKDLLTDIIAGLSIVFEGEYQVGDIIDVGGYRGEVLEIGVRTTKLEGPGGNIKIISNRDIKNVINMTRKNSWYPLEVVIASDLPLDQIEEMLQKKLPSIGESIPQVISGPYYNGVISFGKGTVTLSIITEFNEKDYHYVQRALKHAVATAFEEYDISIK